MILRSFILLLLLFTPSVVCELYFSGAFKDKISNISTLIKTIVTKGDQETSHAKLFLSRIAITATEFPVEAEGSGEQTQKKTYIPLSQFQKYAAWYLDTVEQQEKTADQKTQLGESLRELRMDNVRRQLPMDKYIESVEGTEAVDKYNQFEEKMIEIEKHVIKFFTLKKSQQFSSEAPDDIPALIQELNNLLGDGEIFDLILTKHRYVDDVFVKLYNHFRKYAIFLTVARSIKEIQGNSELLSNNELFDEHVVNVTIGYQYFLDSVGKTNERREKSSFTFANMFSADQLDSLTESSVLPLPDNHNLFNFVGYLERFEKKYSFLVVRRCGERSFCSHFRSGDRFVTMEHSTCTTTLYRTKLEDAPHYRFRTATSLKRIAKSILNQNLHYTTTADEIVKQDHEHIAICTTMTHSTVSDTAYSDQYIDKFVVSLEGRYQQAQETQYGEDSEEEPTHEWKNCVIQVIGYYLAPKSYIY